MPLSTDLKEQYDHHASSLRNWLMIYGVGGPALFLAHEKIYDKISDSGYLPLVAILFMGGAAIQILLALFDKYSEWVLYYELETGAVTEDVLRTQLRERTLPVATATPRRLARSWMWQNWLSFLLEALSILAFVIGTMIAILALAS